MRRLSNWLGKFVSDEPPMITVHSSRLDAATAAIAYRRIADNAFSIATMATELATFERQARDHHLRLARTMVKVAERATENAEAIERQLAG